MDLLRDALARAEGADYGDARLRSLINMSDALEASGRAEEAVGIAQQGLALAEALGEG